jgi:hypothetical protein
VRILGSEKGVGALPLGLPSSTSLRSFANDLVMEGASGW